MKAVRVRVSGLVQGVFFRQTTARRARELGVSGWVRNLPDGGVEAVFEGAEDAVDAVVQWCQDGPPAAVVAAVDVQPEEASGGTEFRVR